MPETKDSRRKTGRMRLNVHCDIKGLTGTISGPVKDLSLDGCGVLSPGNCPTGETVELTLRLPTRVDIPAEVRWVSKSGNLFVIGCRFVHTGGSREALQEGLQRLASSIDRAGRGIR